MENVKYLISDSFVALRKGNFVQASEGNGEFVYESANADEHALATIIEIAQANGLKISSKAKKAEAIEQLNAHLETIKLPEVNKMTETQIVEEVIEAGLAAEQSDDEMLVEIVNRGVSFKSAGKLFKSVMESKGLRISAKERAEKAAQILAGEDFGAEEVTEDDIANAVSLITSGIADTSEKQALIAVRKYAKEKGIELPKVSKSGAGRSAGTGGLLKQISEFMLGNRDCDEAAIEAHIRTLKDDITDGQLKKYKTNAMRMLDFAKSWAE